MPRTVTCAACQGEGCIDDRRPWQDPQQDWRVGCEACGGWGEVEQDEEEASCPDTSTI